MKTNHTHLLREGHIKNVASVEIRLLGKKKPFCRTQHVEMSLVTKKDFPQDFPFLMLFSSIKRVREMEVNKKEFP